MYHPLPLDKGSDGGMKPPYRPTPLKFEVDGKKCFNERPISTQQTGFSYIAQLRSSLPREIGGIIWFGNDDGNVVAYVPIYCSNTERAECFNTPGANANAVKEAVLASILLSARDYIAANSWANGLSGDDVPKQVEAGKKQFAGTEISLRLPVQL